MLPVWVNEKQPEGDTVTENFVCEKAKALYTNRVSELPGTSTENKKASRPAGDGLITLRGEVAFIVL